MMAGAGNQQGQGCPNALLFAGDVVRAYAGVHALHMSGGLLGCAFQYFTLHLPRRIANTALSTISFNSTRVLSVAHPAITPYPTHLRS